MNRHYDTNPLDEEQVNPFSVIFSSLMFLIRLSLSLFFFPFHFSLLLLQIYPPIYGLVYLRTFCFWVFEFWGVVDDNLVLDLIISRFYSEQFSSKRLLLGLRLFYFFYIYKYRGSKCKRCSFIWIEQTLSFETLYFHYQKALRDEALR